MLERLWRKGNTPTLLVGMLSCYSHYGKQYGDSSENWKIELLYNPAISLLRIYADKPIIHKDTCTPMFIEALFTTAKT